MLSKKAGVKTAKPGQIENANHGEPWVRRLIAHLQKACAQRLQRLCQRLQIGHIALRLL